MPEVNDDTNTEETSVQKLKSALDKEREAHKASRAELLGPIRKALQLADTASLDEITKALGDINGHITAKTTDITAERDAAVAKATKIEGERNAERIEAAIQAGLSKSGMIEQHYEDAASIIRGVVEVNKDGKVTTKAALNIVAGQSVDQFMWQLRSMRGFYWPMSIGGGSKGNTKPLDSHGDGSMFDPKSANYSLTRQFAAEAVHGKAWADEQIKRYGGRR